MKIWKFAYTILYITTLNKADYTTNMNELELVLGLFRSHIIIDLGTNVLSCSENYKDFLKS